MQRYILVVFLTLLVLGCSDGGRESLPKQIRAKVIRIIDGDTIEVLYNGKALKIRLAHIDCPEIRKKQPYGSAAKKFLSDRCFGRFVSLIHFNEFDMNGRLIAEIINDEERNLNQELVRNGLAWHFKRYSTDCNYALIEDSARSEKIAIWSETSPIPPWVWRAKKN